MLTPRLLPSLAAVAVATVVMLAPLAVSAAQSPRTHGDSIAVAAHVLARGAVLTDDDITYIGRTPLMHPADLAAPDVQEGWVARRIVKAGEVLRAPAVSPPIVMTANQTIDVIYADRDIMITRRAVVTRDASVGDRVTVRTADGHHLDGIVTGPGRVTIE